VNIIAGYAPVTFAPLIALLPALLRALAHIGSNNLDDRLKPDHATHGVCDVAAANGQRWINQKIF